MDNAQLPNPEQELGDSSEQWSRRDFITRAGTAGLALGVLPSVLAACGSSGGGGATTTTAGGPHKASGTIDYFGWQGEDWKKQNAAFVKRNGLRIKTEAMVTASDPIAKVRGGTSAGMDMLGVSNVSIPRYVDAGILQPIDESAVPNLQNVYPEIMGATGFRIDGKLYAVPTYWSIIGLTRNPKTVRDPFTSWNDVLDPKLKGRVGGYADPAGYIYALCAAMGYPQGKVPKQDLNKLSDYMGRVLDQTKGLAQSYGDLITQLASGEVDVAYPGYLNYDAFVPASGGPAMQTEIDLKEGSVLYADGTCIPTTADNADSVLAYANSLLEPKTNAAMSELVGSGVVVPDAVQYQSHALRKIMPYDELPQLVKDSQWALDLPTNSDDLVTQSEWTERFTALTA